VGDKEKIHEIWIKYKKNKDDYLREKLILEYSYLVKYVAGCLNIYFGATIDFDDLLSYGVFGLLDAIEKFDLGKGVKFETYASLRIRGAIIDNIRKLDWVPRTVRQKSKQVEKAFVKLETEYGRVPNDEEMAEELGLSIDKYNQLQNDINLSYMLSLDEYIEQNNEKNINYMSENVFADPLKQAEINAIKEVLEGALDFLSEKEKTVVSLYYYEDMTLKEISVIMKVTESRISQLHSKALTKLRNKLGKYKYILY
jgi:RNA polymerase sigma factor for flagellar operon FliA